MKKYLSSLALIGVMVFSSCIVQEPGYLTTTPNIPGLSQKGESRCMGAIGIHHLEGQIAYSPIKRMVVLGNFYSSNEGAKSLQGGLGYYCKPNSRMLFESHLVYSKSDVYAVDVRSYSYFFSGSSETHNLNVKGAYQALALQNGITFGNGAVYEESTSYLTLGLKYDFVQYDFLRSRYVISKSNGIVTEKDLELDPNELNGQIFTFAITGRTYIDRLGFMGQLAFHEGVDRFTSGFSDLPGYSPLWLSFGLELALSRPKHSEHSRNDSPRNRKHSGIYDKRPANRKPPTNKGDRTPNLNDKR